MSDNAELWSDLAIDDEQRVTPVGERMRDTRLSRLEAYRYSQEIAEACREIRRLQAIPHIRSCMCAKYVEIIVGYEKTLREAHEELERCSPNAPIVDKIVNKLWARLGLK